MDIRELELFLRGRKGIGKWTVENIKLALQEERILKTLQGRQSYLSTFIPDWVTLDQVCLYECISVLVCCTICDRFFWAIF